MSALAWIESHWARLIIAYSPLWIVLITGCVVLIAELIYPSLIRLLRRVFGGKGAASRHDLESADRELLVWLAMIGLGLALIAGYGLWCSLSTVAPSSSTPTVLESLSMLALDQYGLMFQAVSIIVAALTILMSHRYLKRVGRERGEYYLLVLFATAGMMILGAANNLVMIFVGIELMSISTYILVGIFRTHDQSLEAALKYFLLGAFSSAILLYGIALVYGETSTFSLSRLALELPSAISHPTTLAGLALIVAAFAFKIALVPFHMWVPDVYQGAPTPITAFMAVGVKAAAIASFLRIFVEVTQNLSDVWLERYWVQTLMGLAILTMSVGNIFAIVQSSVKRMLAYSSIAHAGYLMIGLTCFPFFRDGGTNEAATAVVFYLIGYLAMTTGVFAVLCYMGRDGLEYDRFEDFAGMARRFPRLSLALTICLLSLGGVPLTVGFMGKLYLFYAAVNAGFIWLTVIAVINSAISIYYYLRLVIQIYMRDENNIVSAIPSLSIGVAVFATSAATLFFGIFPTPAMNWAAQSIRSLGLH